MSIKFNSPAINGQVDTLRDSGEFSSKGKIDSFAAGGGPKAKDRTVKRESIYKQALMQQLKAANLSKFS